MIKSALDPAHVTRRHAVAHMRARMTAGDACRWTRIVSSGKLVSYCRTGLFSRSGGSAQPESGLSVYICEVEYAWFRTAVVDQ